MNCYSSTKEAPLSSGKERTGASVVLVLPFNPKMTPRPELENSLKSVLGQAEKALLAGREGEDVLPLIRRLQQAIRGLSYSTHRKSVALFVSAEVEKVCYMDMEVEQRVVVDEPFRVRDLASCRRKDAEYLVLALGSRQSKMYRGNSSGLRLIRSSTPHHVDEGLGAVLKAYPLPVFVVGPGRLVGHFSSITRHEKDIAGYVRKHCQDAGEEELLDILRPELADWQGLRQRMIQRQIEKALAAGKLVQGIIEVRKAAGCSNSKLLVFEREAGTPEAISPSFYHDGIIDAIAEKVLENGGEVETVEKGLLADYGNLVLIRYY